MTWNVRLLEARLALNVWLLSASDAATKLNPFVGVS